MRNFEKQLIQLEDEIDNSCAEFIVVKDKLDSGKIHFTGKNIYVDKKHVLSVMERHTTPEQQAIALATFAKVYDLPMKELFQLKHYYRVRAWKLSLRFWIVSLLFIFTIITAGLLWYYEIIQINSPF